MPIMDGKTAARQIRVAQSSPSIIAISAASPSQNLLEECTDAGMNKFLSSPVEVSDLIEIVDSIINKQ